MTIRLENEITTAVAHDDGDHTDGPNAKLTANTFTGAQLFPAGTEALPGVAIGTADNGWWAPAVDQLACSINGNRVLFLESTTLQIEGDLTVLGPTSSQIALTTAAVAQLTLAGSSAASVIEMAGTSSLIDILPPEGTGDSGIQLFTQVGDVAVIAFTTAAGSIRMNNIQVVGPQGAAVANPAGGAIIDTECRAQLVLALARLRTHGLIAT